MDPTSVIEKTVAYVQKAMEGECSGHDWGHVHRVYRTALEIGREEKADLLIVGLAALLHDIADYKFHEGDCTIGPKTARAWLERQGVEEALLASVETIIQDLSFKGAGVETPMATLEGKVVQDADRLDAMGAIGIARAFAFGGSRGRALYDPQNPAEGHASFEAYKTSNSSSINHFYEKLLLLKDRMNTETAKTRAVERHLFMVAYLNQFFKEWDGIA